MTAISGVTIPAFLVEHKNFYDAAFFKFKKDYLYSHDFLNFHISKTKKKSLSRHNRTSAFIPRALVFVFFFAFSKPTRGNKHKRIFAFFLFPLIFIITKENEILLIHNFYFFFLRGHHSGCKWQLQIFMIS